MKSYIIELADDEVLVALKRGEAYEDVHPQLVSEDAIRERWPEYRTIYDDALHLTKIAAWEHKEDPTRVISAVQKAQAESDGGASASSVINYSVPLVRPLTLK